MGPEISLDYWRYTEMKNLEKAVDIIKRFEGICDGDPTTVNLDPYLCPAGYWTIGWGHVVRDAYGNAFKGKETKKKAKAIYPKGITMAEAEALLYDDVKKFSAFVADRIKVVIADEQFCALVSFTFNVGAGAFNRSSLLRLLNEGKYEQVPVQLSKWIKVNGKPSKGLINRRKAEAQLWG